jgi:hypothetical protein
VPVLRIYRVYADEHRINLRACSLRICFHRIFVAA